MIFEVFSKILWKIITYCLYILRITYCPRFSSLFPNSFNWRMFMNLDSDIGSFLKILWKIIIYYLYIFRITYCPHFSSLFPNSFNWRMFMILDSDIGSFLKNIMENNYILFIYI